MNIPQEIKLEIEKHLPINTFSDLINLVVKYKTFLQPIINDNDNSKLLEKFKNELDLSNTQIVLLEKKRKEDEELRRIQDFSILQERHFYKQKLQEMEEAKKEVEKLKELVELGKKKEGVHSMYKGEFEEKHKEMFLNENFGKIFTIDGEKKMNKMDIRMIHKCNNYTIGVECKDKKGIIKYDIDKFSRDKLKNNFKGSIFISIDSEIPNIVEKKDNFYINKNELYIYSNNEFIIKMLINCFIKILECKTDDNLHRIHMETMVVMYNQWSKMKKSFVEYDKCFVNYLNKTDKKLINGHIYLVTKSNCKGNKTPY